MPLVFFTSTHFLVICIHKSFIQCKAHTFTIQNTHANIFNSLSHFIHFIHPWKYITFFYILSFYLFSVHFSPFKSRTPHPLIINPIKSGNIGQDHQEPKKYTLVSLPLSFKMINNFAYTWLNFIFALLRHHSSWSLCK